MQLKKNSNFKFTMTQPSHIAMWEKCLSLIKDNLPPEAFKSWFEPIVCINFADDTLTLGVPSTFFIETLEERYLRILIPAMRKVFGNNVRLFYETNVVRNQPDTNIAILSQNTSPAIRQGLPQANPFSHEAPAEVDSQLNPGLTFDNYCESTSNKVALAIGKAIGSDPKCRTFNPFLIIGPSGVGKTHLMHAIGISLKEHQPSMRVLYITARLFTSQYSVAATSGRINEFIRFYQGIDALLIDDIQDLIGNPKTQQAFFHIFSSLQLNGKQIILSSDVAPSQMMGLTERMLTRLKWGMTVKLERPDLPLRKEVISLKALKEGIRLPSDVLDFIADNVTGSIRELEGVMVSLIYHSTILNVPISVDLARTVVSNAVKCHKKVINFEMIAQGVSSFYNLDPEAIFSKTRRREINDARQMVMYMAKKHTDMASTAIATRLSRTHATILHGCKNIEDRLGLDKQLQADIEKIEKSIFSSANE